MAPAHARNVTWSSLVDGFWDVATSWGPSVPTTGDNVIIARTGGDPLTVTYRSDDLSIGALAIHDHHFILTGGRLNVAGPYNHSGTGITTVTGGFLGLNGSSTLQTLNFSGGNISGAGAASVGSLNWSGGQFGDSENRRGSMTVSGVTTIDGTKQLLAHYGYNLNLNGNTTWTAGQGFITIGYYGDNASTITIGASSTFNDAGTSSASSSRGFGSGGAIVNNGTFNRNGLGVTGIGTNILNNGVINVNSGMLALHNGGYSTGTVNIAGNATLQVTNGVASFTSGAIRNDGELLASGGGYIVIDQAAAYSGQGLLRAVNTGQISFLGSIQTDALQIDRGTITAGASMDVNSIDLSGGTLGGTGITHVNTAMHIGCGGGGTTRTLNLNGTTTWAACNNNSFAITHVNLAAGATFLDAGAGTTNGARTLRGSAFDTTFNNAGTYERNGLGTTILDSSVQNTGAILVNGGTLILKQPISLYKTGTSTGLIRVASGATLQIEGGAFSMDSGTLNNDGSLTISGGAITTLGPDVAYTGRGTIEVASAGVFNSKRTESLTTDRLVSQGGTARFSGAVETRSLEVSGGRGVGSAVSITADSLQWAGGILGSSDQAGGITTVNGTTTISSKSGSKTVGKGHTLNLNGNTTWAANDDAIDFNGYPGDQGRINIKEGATFTDEGTGSRYGNRSIGHTNDDGIIHNAGTFVRLNQGTTLVGKIENTGTVSVKSGKLALGKGGVNTGTLSTEPTGTLAFSGGAFVNRGRIQNQGSISIDKSYVTIKNGTDYSGTGSIEIGPMGALAIDQGELHIGGSFSNLGFLFLQEHTILGVQANGFSNQGLLQGYGTLTAHGNDKILVNHGTIAPGLEDWVGHLTINGDLLLTEFSVIDIDLSSAVDRDLLSISGSLSVGGTLNIQALNHYAPQVGDEFKIMTFDRRTNDVRFTLLTDATQPYQYEAIYSESDITLRVSSVPEPEAWTLMGLGLSALWLGSHRRSRRQRAAA